MGESGGINRISGQLPNIGMPVLSSSQIEQADTSRLYEFGQIVVVKNSTTGFFSLASYVQLDNNGCSQGEVLCTNYATLNQYSVTISATTGDGFQDTMRGIAAATIASQKFGWMYIGGYVEKADLSKTAASAEGLCISGSTAGKLTPNKASSVMNATIGTTTNATVPLRRLAVARTAIATGVGSISIIGVWG